MAEWEEFNFDELDDEEAPQGVPEEADLGRRWEMVDGDATVSVWGLVAEGYVSEWFVTRTRGDTTESAEAKNQTHAEGIAQGLRISWADDLEVDA